MLAALQGGCLAPIAGWGRIDAGGFTLTGRVLSSDGTEKLEATHTGELDQPEQLGRRVADDLLQQGAARLICDARGAT
jgi:hydroxymethylbilane synthase